GWRSALGGQAAEEFDRQQDDETAAQLPKVAKGELALVEKVDSVAKQTKPPAYFTEASLLAAMENAGKQVDDAELAEAMKERGLGTPATRASTIEKLKRDGLIATEKKRVVSTAKGRELIAAIPVAALTSPELTGEWEAKLKQMERGMCERDGFMQQIRDFARAAVTQLSASRPAMTTPAASAIGSCPKCGQAIVESRKAFGCSAWRTGCDFTIWKEISGHKMTIPQVKALLTKGITKQLTFKSAKTGKGFEAQLQLANGKVEFQFAAKK
ncbi:MAG: DNA topoisomerase, partial [Sulfobacillus sp.]